MRKNCGLVPGGEIEALLSDPGKSERFVVSEFLNDPDLWFAQNEVIAHDRLESFVTELTPERIEADYLALADVFWELPSDLAIRLAHTVIEEYLDETRWVEVYLWAFSASRLVPVEDTHWVSRNFISLALQALGKKEEANRLLLESWQAMMKGSGTAYHWLFGRDPSQSPMAGVLAKERGEEPEPNPFEGVSAPWLDADVVAKTAEGTLSGGNFSKEEAQLAELERGLLALVLRGFEGAREQDAEINEVSEGVRQSVLLGIFRAFFETLGLSNGPERLESARGMHEKAPDYVGTIWDNYALAVLAGHHEAYVEAAKYLVDLGCLESAEGLARVSVWHNIPGAARLLAQILGIDTDKILLDGGMERTQEILFQAYQLFGNQTGQ